MVPESVIWLLTTRCNLRCKHCYASRLEERIYDKDIYISLIREMGDMGVSSVGFTGGEPLLFPYLKDLLEVSKSIFPKITIATNGMLIDGEWLEVFKRTGDNLHIYLSLDGLRESHDFLRGGGAFDKVLGKMKVLSENGINFHIMMAIGNFNYKEAGEVAKISYEMGAKTFSIIPIMPSGRAYGERLLPNGYMIIDACERALRVADSLKKELDVWCAPFVRRSLNSPYLRVASCRITMNVDISPKLDILLCDVIDIVAASIVEEGGFKKAYKIFREKDPDPVLAEPCVSCDNYDFCQGGCFSRAYIEKGSIEEPDPLCPIVGGRK